MAYTIYKSNGQQLVTLLDGTVDSSIGLNLVGKNFINYGTVQNENFVWLLENQASDEAPLYPLRGQLWYDTGSSSLKYFDGAEFYSLANTAMLSGGVSVLEDAMLANIASLNAKLVSNVAALTANAATQSGVLSSLWANAAVQDSSINSLWANAATQHDTLQTLIAEVGEAESELAETANTVNGKILLINSNVTAANAAIASLQSSVSTISNTVTSHQNRLAQLEHLDYGALVGITNYAPLSSPALTGTPTAPTASSSDNSTKIATTAFVLSRENLIRSDVGNNLEAGLSNLSSTVNSQLSAKAPLNSPALTGTPTAPTATLNDSTTKIATTAFVRTATQYWDGSRKYVSTSAPTSGQGSDGDIWFQYV